MTKEHGIGFYMKKINDYLIADGNEHLKQYDITLTQMHILTHIVKSPNSTLTQKEIERVFNIAHPTVVGIMKRLSKKGFITISQHPDDKRINCITATKKSMEMVDTMYEGRKHVDHMLVRSLTEEQAAELTKLLTIIYKDLYR